MVPSDGNGAVRRHWLSATRVDRRVERRLFKQNSIDKHERQTSKPKNSSAIDLIVPPPSLQLGWCRRALGRRGARGARGRAEHGKAFEAALHRPPAAGRSRGAVHTALLHSRCERELYFGCVIILRYVNTQYQRNLCGKATSVGHGFL